MRQQGTSLRRSTVGKTAEQQDAGILSTTHLFCEAAGRAEGSLRAVYKSLYGKDWIPERNKQEQSG